MIRADWNEGRGAATWVNGSNGTTLDSQNTVTAQNSLVGGTANAGLEDAVQPGTLQGALIASFLAENSGRVTIGLPDPNLITYAVAKSQSVNITPSFLTHTLNAGTNVVLQASRDISINSPITVSPSDTAGSLTLAAGRSILLNASIDTHGGNLTLIANDTRANGVVDEDRDAGNAVITMASGVTIATRPGALSIDLKTSTDKTHNGKGVVTLLGLSASSVTLSADTVLGVSLSGSSPGDGSPGTYTQTSVTGSIDLGGASLALTNARRIRAGQRLVIIQSSGTLVGTFAGLPEGSELAAGGQSFQISYQRDQVSLTALLELTPKDLPAAHVGVAFNQQLSAEVGTEPYHFIVDSGALPPGLSLTPDGLLNGKPTAAGSFTFTVRATDQIGGTGAESFTLTVDNDPPVLAFAAATFNASENSGHATVTITRTGPPTGTMTVNFMTYDGTAVAGRDYYPTSGQLVFLSGEMSKQFTVSLVDDGRLEGEESLNLFLSSPSGSASPGGARSAQLIISDDDQGVTPSRSFVRALYLDFLGRPGATAELDGWVNQLPQIDKLGVANAIIHSPEALRRLVNSFYLRLLGRPATGDPGSENWVEKLVGGGTIEELSAGILASQEFRDRANVLFGRPSADENYVRALYGLLLNRTPSDGEVAGWLRVLPFLGRGEVAGRFLNSAECRGGAVRNLYGDITLTPFPYQPFFPNLLRRAAHPADAEVSGWVNSGLDMLQIELRFAATGEFFNNG